MLGLLSGDSLALEASGDLLTGGFSLFGDGVFRIDATNAAPEPAEERLHERRVARPGGRGRRYDPRREHERVRRSRPVSHRSDDRRRDRLGDRGALQHARGGRARRRGRDLRGRRRDVLARLHGRRHHPRGSVERSPERAQHGRLIEGEMDLAVAEPVPEPGVLPALAAGLGLLARLRRARVAGRGARERPRRGLLARRPLPSLARGALWLLASSLLLVVGAALAIFGLYELCCEPRTPSRRERALRPGDDRVTTSASCASRACCRPCW